MAFTMRKLTNFASAGRWLRELQTELFGTASALTAFAGGGQGSATPITTANAHFGTVATAGDSAKLPATAVGITRNVVNATATSMNVFPATGEAINALSANAAYAIAAGKTVSFTCYITGKWHALLSG
jgi:hypothetical protein